MWARASCWILLLAGCAGIAAHDSDPNPRRREIRRLIKRNLHFSLHGFQKVVDGRTAPAVRRHVTEADLTILASLLDEEIEPEHVIRVGAAAVMEKFGEVAMPYLREAERKGSLEALTALFSLAYNTKHKSTGTNAADKGSK